MSGLGSDGGRGNKSDDWGFDDWGSSLSGAFSKGMDLASHAGSVAASAASVAASKAQTGLEHAQSDEAAAMLKKAGADAYSNASSLLSAAASSNTVQQGSLYMMLC